MARTETGRFDRDGVVAVRNAAAAAAVDVAVNVAVVAIATTADRAEGGKRLLRDDDAITRSMYLCIYTYAPRRRLYIYNISDERRGRGDEEGPDRGGKEDIQYTP